MSARKEPDKSKSPYDFESNKGLLQPIWDRFKADLAKYGVRPWDRVEEKDNHGDNHFSIGQAVWDLPCGKRATLDYVSRCGRPDEFIFWSDFDHIKGRYEPGPTGGLTHDKAIEEIRRYLGWVKAHEDLLRPCWVQFQDELAKAGIRLWDRLDYTNNPFYVDWLVEWDVPSIRVGFTGDQDKHIFWLRGEEEEGLDRAQIIAKLTQVFTEEPEKKIRLDPRAMLAKYVQRYTDALEHGLKLMKEAGVPETWTSFFPCDHERRQECGVSWYWDHGERSIGFHVCVDELTTAVSHHGLHRGHRESAGVEKLKEELDLAEKEGWT